MKKKLGRNYPCPCGSGRKYKKCCLAVEKEAEVSDFAWRKLRQTEGDVILLAHDPTNKKVSLKDLDDVLVYYEMVEYYERCAVLKKIIEKRNKKKG